MSRWLVGSVRGHGGHREGVPDGPSGRLRHVRGTVHGVHLTVLSRVSAAHWVRSVMTHSGRHLALQLHES